MQMGVGGKAKGEFELPSGESSLPEAILGHGDVMFDTGTGYEMET
jgi:hypothetical protein